MARIRHTVRLVAHTPQPERVIAAAARGCYSALDLDGIFSELTPASQAKLIRRVVGMGHHSVLEHASFTFSLEGVSRALLAQITRHRIASFSVQSQRYVGQTSDGLQYILPPSIQALGEDAIQEFDRQMRVMQGWYDEWVQKLGDQGERSNEDARFVLPNAAATRMLVTMNARELLHFFALRCCNRAQWEVRNVAWDMLALAAPIAPAVFGQAGPACVCGACAQGKKSCGACEMVRERVCAILGDRKEER